MATKRRPSKAATRTPLETHSEQGHVQQDDLTADAIALETDGLIGVAEQLEKVSQNFINQRQQYQQFLSMQRDIKELMSRIMAGIESNSVASAVESQRLMVAQPRPAARMLTGSDATGQGRGDCESECDCVSTGCCCFEIVLERMRATRPQIDPPDVGEIPLLTNALEIQIYGEAGELGKMTGTIFPALSSTVDLHIDAIGGNPGPWMPIGRVLNRIFVPKGKTKTVFYKLEVRESDEGAERVFAWKDEYGEWEGQMELNCCVPLIYPPMTPELHMLHGGEGRGKVQAVILARRVCC